MSLSIFVTDVATEDAISIADSLAEHAGLDTSDRFLGAITQAYRRLAEMPGLGAPRDFGPNLPALRTWPVPGFTRYRIFYQASDSEIRIVRVLHGSQNLSTIFSPPDAG